MRSLNRVLTVFFLLAWLAGCATTGTVPGGARSADGAVSDAVVRGDCEAAAEATNALAQRFPDSPSLGNARLETASICIASQEPQRAREQSGKLLTEAPSHPRLDQAYHLYAIAGYQLWKGDHGMASGTPELLADIETARGVIGDFREFVTRFPDSEYREEVLPYLVDLREGLARSELQVARNLFEVGDYGQAAARAAYVGEHYADTGSAPNALTLEMQALARIDDPPPVAIVATPRAAERPPAEAEPARVQPAPPRAPPTAATEPLRPAEARSAPPTAATEPLRPVEVRAAPPMAVSGLQRPAEIRAAPQSRDVAWIRDQPRNAFTIQILGLGHERGIRDFLRQEALEGDVAWFQTQRNGGAWFVAIFGSYPNAEAARAAIGGLPAGVRRNQPWIRSFGSVQDAITAP
jgi:outer membrane protein assembly factor BamD